MQIVLRGPNGVVLLGILICVVSLSMRAQEQCEPQAVTVAQRFIYAQFQGASIGGTPEAFKEARTLVIEDGEPPASPIVFVAGYKIKQAAAMGKECCISIMYERLGTISPESLKLKPAKYQETVHIWLARDPDTWKVHMDAKQYGISPHVGADAIRNWLHLFLQPPIDAKTAKAKRLLKTIDKYQATAPH